MAARLDRHELVRRVHATPTMVVLAVTGGGVVAIVDLLAVPGASRTVLEASVPYAASALADLLGGPPAQATSGATAAAMARACRRRAEALRPEPTVAVAGVACTAALVTDRARRGEHRAHVATATGAGTRVWTLALERGARDRPGEDRLVSDLVLRAVADACGLTGADRELTLELGPGDGLSSTGLSSSAGLSSADGPWSGEGPSSTDGPWSTDGGAPTPDP